MKKCTRCGIEKPFSAFWKKARSKDGYDQQCADCKREYHREFYHSDRSDRKSQIRRNSRKYVLSLRSVIEEILRNSHCVDCGMDDWRVLEFDHVRGEKTHDVSALFRRSPSKARLLEEIAKCEIVCANCHRIRTYQRSGSWRAGEPHAGVYPPPDTRLKG